MSDNVTIKDIASALNLSATAVSRALRDMPDISEKTRERVKAQAKLMKYSKNSLASTLRTRSSHTIGFIMDILNPVYIGMYRGVEDVCRKYGYTILFSTTNENPDDERRAIDTMMSHQVDGILSCPSLNMKNIDKMKRLSVPSVLIGRTVDDPEIYSVVSSDFRGGYEVCSHLISRGRRSFMYITVPLDFAPARERCEGFRQCMSDNGIPQSALEVVISEPQTYTLMGELLDAGFKHDSVFCFNDTMAIGVLKQLHNRAIPVPSEIAVVGYDNIDKCELTIPELTTVDLMSYKQGQDGMLMLLDLIAKKKLPEEARRISFPPSLVIRKST